MFFFQYKKVFYKCREKHGSLNNVQLNIFVKKTGVVSIVSIKHLKYIPLHCTSTILRKCITNNPEKENKKIGPLFVNYDDGASWLSSFHQTDLCCG